LFFKDILFREFLQQEKRLMDMALIDKLKSFKITPDRAFYHPGEVVRLIVSVEASKAMDLDLDVKIFVGLN
jgi:hypothetical protein